MTVGEVESVQPELQAGRSLPSEQNILQEFQPLPHDLPEDLTEPIYWTDVDAEYKFDSDFDVQAYEIQSVEPLEAEQTQQVAVIEQEAKAIDIEIQQVAEVAIEQQAKAIDIAIEQLQDPPSQREPQVLGFDVIEQLQDPPLILYVPREAHEVMGELAKQPIQVLQHVLSLVQAVEANSNSKISASE